METEPDIEVQRKAALVLWHVDGLEEGSFNPVAAPNMVRIRRNILVFAVKDNPNDEEIKQKAIEYEELIRWVEGNPWVDSEEVRLFRRAEGLEGFRTYE